MLVATDIAARGIDIDQLPHVVNYDLAERPRGLRPPHRPHRPRGRGRRSDLAGCVDEHAFLRDIERLIKRDIPQEVIPGFEPDSECRRTTGIRATRTRADAKPAAPGAEGKEQRPLCEPSSRQR